MVGYGRKRRNGRHVRLVSGEVVIGILCSTKLYARAAQQEKDETYPKNATAQDHPTAAIHDKCTGGTPSRSSSSSPSAGKIPTKPAARGIYHTARINMIADSQK